ncbi:MAG: type II secretion system F family protein [Chloroflexota bacterium]
MSLLNIVIIAAVVLILLMIILAVFALRTSGDDVLAQRIGEYAAREEVASIEEIELSLGFTDRVITPALRRFGLFITRFTPSETLERTTRNLEAAGWKRTATEFWGYVLFTTIALGAAGIYVAIVAQPERIVIFALGGLAAGFFLPRLQLGSAVSRRKDQVVKKLPDALDLMTICVDAGLTFDGAMAKVDEKWDDPLSKEFGRVVYEIQLGKTRRQSLKDMSERLDVPDVQSFIASVLQADQLGVSIGKVLRIQSEQMRIRRRQRAEEKAQQAPIKMLFPMVFLIFPAMFVVLLGPAVIRVWKAFWPEGG